MKCIFIVFVLNNITYKHISLYCFCVHNYLLYLLRFYNYHITLKLCSIAHIFIDRKCIRDMRFQAYLYHRFVLFHFLVPRSVLFDQMFPLRTQFVVATLTAAQLFWQFHIDRWQSSGNKYTRFQFGRHKHSKCIQNSIHIQRCIDEFQSFHQHRIRLPAFNRSIHLNVDI